MKETVFLLDVCDFKGGTQPPKDEWVDDPREGYIRMLQIRDYSQGDEKFIQYVKDTKRLHKCTEEDIMLSRYGYIGQAFIGLSGAYNVALVKVVKRIEVDTNFLLYYFKSKRFIRQLEANVGSRATIPGFNKEELKTATIDLPDQKTQIAIGGNLLNIDLQIKKHESELEILDSLVKSRFIEMFGDSSLAIQDDAWKPISTVCTVVGGATPKTKIEKYWNGDAFWITPAEIDNNTVYVYQTERKLTEEGVRSASLTLMPINTVLLSSRAPIGKVAITGIPMYCNQGFKNLICGPKVEPRFLYELLSYNNDYLNSLGRGATFKELSKSIVESVRIPVPSIELQEQFTTIAEQVDKSKFVIQRAIDKLELLKASLMQEYFG